MEPNYIFFFVLLGLQSYKLCILDTLECRYTFVSVNYAKSYAHVSIHKLYHNASIIFFPSEILKENFTHFPPILMWHLQPNTSFYYSFCLFLTPALPLVLVGVQYANAVFLSFIWSRIKIQFLRSVLISS